MFFTTTSPFLPGILASRQNMEYPLQPTLSLPNIQLNCQQFPSAQTSPTFLSSDHTSTEPLQQIKPLCDFQLGQTKQIKLLCDFPARTNKGMCFLLPWWAPLVSLLGSAIYAILYSCSSLPPLKSVLSSMRNGKTE